MRQSGGASISFRSPITILPPEERDETLPEKLKTELPGILAWMIAGCAEWLESRLAPPQIVTEATDQYLQAEDAIAGDRRMRRPRS